MSRWTSSGEWSAVLTKGALARSSGFIMGTTVIVGIV